MVSEFKVATIWSIKKETFMKVLEEILFTDYIQATLGGFRYRFRIVKYNTDDIAISFDDMKNLKVKELTVSIPTADFEGDLSSPADVPEGHYFDGLDNAVVIKFEDILDPDENFFVDDILTLEFRGIIELQEKPAIKSLNELLWDSEEDKDFTFVNDKNDIMAHKLVLRRYSTKLAKMFDEDIDQIEVKDFKYATVYYALRLCYDFPCSTDVDELLDCLRFANRFEMAVIKERIAHQLSDEINVKSVCQLANMSVEFKCSTLKQSCISFMSKCIKDDKPFDGAANLNEEIKKEVYDSFVFHTVTS